MTKYTKDPGYGIEEAETDIGGLRGMVTGLGEYAEFVTAVVDTLLVAAQPGTSTEPMTQETPHSITMGGSPAWTGTVRYWLNPDNVTVHISISNATAPSSGVNNNVFATLPTGYTPTATRGTAIGCTIANSNISSYITVNSSGQMQTNGVGISSTGVYVEWDMPLI